MKWLKSIWLLLYFLHTPTYAIVIPVAITANATNLSMVASRAANGGTDKCYAPCAIFWDATGTTNSGTTTPFHNLQYSWSFGDAVVGAAGSCGTAVTSGQRYWSCGSNAGANSKNTATGSMAAHVHETPGTYPVTLIIYDGTNPVATQTQSIVVSDPDGVGSPFLTTGTVCASNDVSPIWTGCPTGAAQESNSLDLTALCTSYGMASRRILLQRGGTWTAAAPCVLATAGTVGIVGAFGLGAKPIISPAAKIPAIQLSSSGSPSFADWRLMDLNIVGQNAATGVGVYFAGGAKRVTSLRVDASSICEGFDLSVDTLIPSGAPVWDQIIIADSIANAVGGGAHDTGCNAVFASATRFAFLGSLAGDSTQGEHGMRNPYLSKAVISNSSFGPSAPDKVALTVRAPDFLGSAFFSSGVYTEYIVAGDNKLIGTTAGSTGSIVSNGSAGPDLYRGLQRNEVWERNWFVAASATSTHIDFSGCSQITLRNNVFAMTGGANHIGIGIDQADHPTPDSPQTACNGMWIYNNTFYSNDTAANFRAVGVSEALRASNITVQNNLAYAPNDSAHLLILDGAAGPTTNLVTCASCNSSDAQIGGPGTNPNFTSLVAPFTPTKARPTVGSYAIGVGASVPVWSDFFLTVEPSPRDMGAVNH